MNLRPLAVLGVMESIPDPNNCASYHFTYVWQEAQLWDQVSGPTGTILLGQYHDSGFPSVPPSSKPVSYWYFHPWKPLTLLQSWDWEPQLADCHSQHIGTLDSDAAVTCLAWPCNLDHLFEARWEMATVLYILNNKFVTYSLFYHAINSVNVWLGY